MKSSGAPALEDSQGVEGQASAQQGPDVKLGVTRPISLAMPTQADLEQSEKMQEDLRRDAPLESQEGMRSRACVLSELHRVVLQWIQEASKRQGMDDESA